MQLFSQKALFLLILLFCGGIVLINGKSIVSGLNKKISTDQIIKDHQTDQKTHFVGWGRNKYGQLGLGNVDESVENNDYQKIPLQQVSDLSPGLNHTLVLTDDASVLAFGNNSYGQIGDGTAVDLRSTPVVVSGLSTIKKVSAGQFFSLALATDGTVWSWGHNLAGQLGDGTNADRNSPQKIEGLFDVVDVVAAYRTGIALKKDGTVWVWGGSCDQSLQEEFAQALTALSRKSLLEESYFDADATTIEGNNRYAMCFGEAFLNIHSKRPIQITTLPKIAAISAGFGHFLVLDEGGSVWSWGCNKYGQVGNATAENNDRNKIPEKITSLPPVIEISAGFRHSMALTADGSVWSWGHNGFGELGLGEEIWEDQTSPQKIPNLVNISHIRAGHDYSIVIDTDAQLWGWGEDNYNQLGKYVINGGSHVPIRLLRDFHVQKMWTGGGHMIVLVREEV